MMTSVKALSIGLFDDSCFVSAIVSAEFKDVSYTVRVVIHNTGEVMNSDCDCPTGKKNVQLIFLFVRKMLRNASNGIALGMRCTLGCCSTRQGKTTNGIFGRGAHQRGAHGSGAH